MEDYKKEYNDFWKDIVENKDGTLNKEQVMKELADFSMVIGNISSAYDIMTEGIISKPNTLFSEVEKIFGNKYYSKSLFDIYGCSEDLIDILNNCDDVNELKKEIRKYFEIRGE